MRAIDDPRRLPPRAPHARVRAARRGIVARVDAGLLGRAATLLGAGRLRKQDRIAPGAAILLHAKMGSRSRAAICWPRSNTTTRGPRAVAPADRARLRRRRPAPAATARWCSRRWAADAVAFPRHGASNDDRPRLRQSRHRRGGGVLLHPFPFTRLIWAGFAEVVAAHRRVIAVDARGFGGTPPAPGGAFSMDNLADDVATLLDRLGIARCTLLGQSMGGYAALAFAARYANRLEGLVLCDTRATADSAEARAGRATALATLRDAGVQGYLAASLPRQLMPGAPPARVTHLRARAETRAASLTAGVEALRNRPDRTGVLATLRCPTLVVCGDGNRISPPAEMKQMAAAIPGATFRGHRRGRSHLPRRIARRIPARRRAARRRQPCSPFCSRKEPNHEDGRDVCERVQTAARAAAEQTRRATPTWRWCWARAWAASPIG